MKAAKLSTSIVSNETFQEMCNMKISAKRVGQIGYDIVVDNNGDIGFVYNGRGHTIEREEAWRQIRNHFENTFGYGEVDANMLMEKLGTEMFKLDLVQCIVDG